MRDFENKHDRALRAVRDLGWASQLVKRVEEQGGARKAPLGLLFELRFAFELTRWCPGIEPRYEAESGVGNSTVDFAVPWKQRRWLIELVSIRVSEGVSRAIEHVEVAEGVSCQEHLLFSEAADARRTPHAEVIRVSEKIQEKASKKFPVRNAAGVHVLLIDMSGFEGGVEPDATHCREIAHGSRAVPEEDRLLDNMGTPVLGLFDPSNPRSVEVRRRVDLLGFVSEHPGYEDDDEIGKTAYFVANPECQNPRELIVDFPVRAPQPLRDPLGERARRSVGE